MLFVALLFGARQGAELLVRKGRLLVHPGGGVPGTPNVADFDADGHDDLAVGTPDEAVTRIRGAGSLTVLRGCVCGLTDAGSQRFTQATTGVQGEPGRDDGFGFGLENTRLALVWITGTLTFLSLAAYLKAWFMHMTGYASGRATPSRSPCGTGARCMPSSTAAAMCRSNSTGNRAGSSMLRAYT